MMYGKVGFARCGLVASLVQCFLVFPHSPHLVAWGVVAWALALAPTFRNTWSVVVFSLASLVSGGALAQLGGVVLFRSASRLHGYVHVFWTSGCGYRLSWDWPVPCHEDCTSPLVCHFGFVGVLFLIGCWFSLCDLLLALGPLGCSRP